MSIPLRQDFDWVFLTRERRLKSKISQSFVMSDEAENAAAHLARHSQQSRYISTCMPNGFTFPL
jgi:hypothetical protein